MRCTAYVLGPVRPDDCYCPEESIEKWLDLYGCNKKTYSQIQEDLKPFQTVNFNKFHKGVVQKFNNSASMSLCNYVIIKNQVSVYVTCLRSPSSLDIC